MPPAYACSANGTCALPSDQCSCVPSCPACDDCPRRICVPACVALDITTVTINAGVSQLVVGRQGQIGATAQLSDGTQIDVTYLVTWESSNDSVARVDSWGTVTALAVGTTNLTASLGTITSAPSPLEVVEKPTLQAISVQNQSCFCGPVAVGPPTSDLVPRPCVINPPP